LSALASACLALSACAFDDPRVVVEEAAAAARSGDREALLACFTPRSQAVLEAWWRAADKAQPTLAGLDAADVRVVAQRPFSDRDYGPERALLSVREGGRQMSLVVHHLGGSWRIDLHDTERVGQGGTLP